MRFLFLIPLLLLAACYHPLYGSKDFSGTPSAQEKNLNSIFIAGIPDENGQRLRNLLIDRFYGAGRPATTSTRLEVQLVAFEEKLGLQKDATTTRARLNLTSNYTLFDSATNKPLFRATSRSTVSYNILDDQYATLALKEDAYSRGVRELSELMTTRLLLYFSNGGGPSKPPASITPPAPEPLSPFIDTPGALSSPSASPLAPESLSPSAAP
jgi:LPS-assembly lipoprotein